MSLTEAMPHLADLQHVAYTQNEGGDETQTAQTAYAADEPCWFQVASATEVKAFAARNQEVTHRVYFGRDPGLRLADVLTAKDGDDQACPYNGQEFEFIAFAECTAGFGILWKAMVKLVKEP